MDIHTREECRVYPKRLDHCRAAEVMSMMRPFIDRLDKKEKKRFSQLCDYVRQFRERVCYRNVSSQSAHSGRRERKGIDLSTR